MALEIAFQLLNPPEGRIDGSGQVKHDVDAVQREEGTSNGWITIPNHHKDFLLTEVEVNDAMDQPTDPGKVVAYKDYLEANVNTPPTPLPEPPSSDWSEQGLKDYTVAYEVWQTERDVQNLAAFDAAVRVNQFIIGKGWAYPIQFRLDI